MAINVPQRVDPKGIDLGTHSVLGLPIRAVDYAAAIGEVIEAARSGCPLSVSALAVHGVMTGLLDREHRYRLKRLSMLVPDGQPVRWALRWLHGIKLADRVYGPNLMLKCCEAAAAHDIPVFLYGSTEDTLDSLTANLKKSFPGLVVAGAVSSRFRQLEEDEQQAVYDSIKSSGARITFVGLGCPRQEVWAFENAEALQMPVLAVGAAFDFHAGKLAHLQDRGLEWAFRLYCEPLRLWRRYLYLNPLFLWNVALQRLGFADFSDECQPKNRFRYG